VSDPLEATEAEEPARPLDRMNRAEDAGEHVAGAGVALQGEQVAAQPMQALDALDQELRDDLVHLVRHRFVSPLPCAVKPGAFRAREPRTAGRAVAIEAFDRGEVGL